MSIKDVSKFVPPAGATPNELAATGPGAAAVEWLLARRDVLALTHAAGVEAADQRRAIAADRVTMVGPLFSEHVRELERNAVTAPEVGAGAGALAGGVWGAWKWKDTPALGGLFRVVLVGVVAGAAGGWGAGHLYQRVYGPVRPHVPAQLPQGAEDRLRQMTIACVASAEGAAVAEDVPAWRVDGWRETWAALVAQYRGTATTAITLPEGAPSPRDLAREVRHLVPRLLG
jgi:hypothetical protein